MKIAVLNPKSEFTDGQIKRLQSFGEVVFVEKREEYPIEKLLQLSEGAEILALDPDIVGGFEKAKLNVSKIIEFLPGLKGICLGTTSYGWIDLELCKKRNISVSNCPGWSRDSVAEQTIAFILNAVRRITLTDRETQKGGYKLTMASEIKGKTLGIIGLGSIGSRVAELAHNIGMKVIAYNRSSRNQENVQMKSLDEVLQESDVLSIHVPHIPENENMIDADAIFKTKKGVIFINLCDRSVVDEAAMGGAIKNGHVASYMLELEKFEGSPISGLDNVIMMKPFAWFTKEALDRLIELWTSNIESMAKGTPQNTVG